MTQIIITTESPESAAAIVEILIEVERAEKKHPVWPECHVKQIAIVSEEAGELVRAGNQLDEGKGSFADLRMEAIQTAATAIRFIKLLRQTELNYNQPDIIEYFANDPLDFKNNGIGMEGDHE